MRKRNAIAFGLVAAALALSAEVTAKAYFAPLPEMIANADAIGVVEVLSERALRPEEEGARCRDAVASVAVKQTIVGDLTGVSRVHVPCFFPCAVVDLRPGRYLVFLETRDGVLTNSNWHLSLRPITNAGVAWFEPDGRTQVVTPLAHVLADVRRRAGAVTR